MGPISKQLKTGKDSGRIKSRLRKKSTNGLKSTRIPKESDRSQSKISKKTVKRYFTGEVKKTQRLNSKTQHKNTLKTALKILHSHNVTPLESKILSVVSEHKHSLKLEQVEACVSAMLKLKSSNSKSKEHLLFDEVAQPIHMTVQCIKVPIMNSKNYRFCLPNPLVDESSEVGLFVPNLKKGRSEDHEPTIEHYRDILEKHNVKGITQIIPLRQINVEYDQYDLRRSLVSQFDMFLADGRITGHVQGLLGKEIYKRRKLPVPVDFRVKDIKKEVDKALSKTLLMMHGNGSKASLKVGHTKQSLPQIAENIMAVAEGLTQHFPGGWANIRSLKIHLQDSVPVPVYISLENSNNVEVPVVTPVFPKKAVPVQGEISTMPGVRVTVLPGGGVIIKKKPLTKEERKMGFSDSDVEDFDPKEQMDTYASEEETTSKDQVKEDPLPNAEEQKDDDTASDVSSMGGDEHVVEAAENMYLSKWREQWNETIQEESRKRKEKTVDDVKDAPQIKKPKVTRDKTKRKTAKKVKGKEIENKNSKNNNKVDDVKDAPQTKKPKVIKDKTKIKTAKKVKGKGIENKNSKDSNKVDDVKDAPQIKKPKVTKDKTKRKTAKKVMGKEIENKNSKNNNKVLQSMKERKMNKIKSTDVISPLITSSKKLKMKSRKTAVNVKIIAKKQKINKNFVSQKKKKKTAA